MTSTVYDKFSLELLLECKEIVYKHNIIDISFDNNKLNDYVKKQLIKKEQYMINKFITDNTDKIMKYSIETFLNKTIYVINKLNTKKISKTKKIINKILDDNPTDKSITTIHDTMPTIFTDDFNMISIKFNNPVDNIVKIENSTKRISLYALSEMIKREKKIINISLKIYLHTNNLNDYKKCNVYFRAKLNNIMLKNNNISNNKQLTIYTMYKSPTKKIVENIMDLLD
jgi:hypothetical protein